MFIPHNKAIIFASCFDINNEDNLYNKKVVVVCDIMLVIIIMNSPFFILPANIYIYNVV